ncbi:Utp12 domain-containing protein [Aphelenchoides besseyi]|nr:Utp12 domain-containing protein [Aphelenchoides besseyi]
MSTDQFQMSTATSTCQFFIKKNKRNCQNAPKEGHQFCYRHLSTEVEGSSREVSESPAPSLKNQPVASPIEEEGESVHVSPQKLFGTSTASQPIEQSPSSPEVAVQSDPKLTPRSSPVKSKQSDSSPSKRSTTSKLSVSTAIEAPEILNKKRMQLDARNGYSLWLSRCIKANDWEGINNVFENIHSNPRSLSSNLVSGLAFQLSRDDVLPFLKIAANVLLDQHSQRTSSAPVIAGLWFKFVDDVIRKHMKELSMIEHLDSEIGELLSYIECRTKNLEQIMRLQGKLQFLFEQTTKRNEGKEAIHDDSAIVFEDGDSDDENIKEVEEIANNSTSDLFSDEDDEKRKKLRSRRSTNHSTSAMEVD